MKRQPDLPKRRRRHRASANRPDQLIENVLEDEAPRIPDMSEISIQYTDKEGQKEPIFKHELVDGRHNDSIPLRIARPVVSLMESYGREHIWKFALGMAGVGFVLGWKLRR